MISLFFLVLASFIAGYGVGLVQKGIHIHQHTVKEPTNVNYNESLVPELPLEVQQYYQKTNGFNQF